MCSVAKADAAKADSVYSDVLSKLQREIRLGRVSWQATLWKVNGKP